MLFLVSFFFFLASCFVCSGISAVSFIRPTEHGMSMDMGTWDMGGDMGIARQDGRCLKGGVDVRGRGVGKREGWDCSTGTG